MTIHTHETEHGMNDDSMWDGNWLAGTGEERTTINGKDYTYGWLADFDGKCLGHAWFCHTDNTFHLTDPAVCPACWDTIAHCKGACS